MQDHCFNFRLVHLPWLARSLANYIFPVNSTKDNVGKDPEPLKHYPKLRLSHFQPLFVYFIFASISMGYEIAMRVELQTSSLKSSRSTN